MDKEGKGPRAWSLEHLAGESWRGTVSGCEVTTKVCAGLCPWFLTMGSSGPQNFLKNRRILCS